MKRLMYVVLMIVGLLVFSGILYNLGRCPAEEQSPAMVNRAHL
jgi:hypothetical protein